MSPTPYFIFDVESLGLHGEGYAVAGGVYINGVAQWEFQYSCPIWECCSGDAEDVKWVEKNIPPIKKTHQNPYNLRNAFWKKWIEAKESFEGIIMAGECIWPVEARFVSTCVRENLKKRKWLGPYPFHEISSIMKAAGMDPMGKYERKPSELPVHNPLADARLSARLLFEALDKISNLKINES